MPGLGGEGVGRSGDAGGGPGSGLARTHLSLMRGLVWGLVGTWEGEEGAGREEAAVVDVEDPKKKAGEEETSEEVDTRSGSESGILGGVGGRVGADLVIITEGAGV